MNLTKEKLKQLILEEFYKEMDDMQLQTITGRPDHEVEMAYRQLKKAARYSQSLRDRMENMEEANLPAWVQAKVTKASDYLSSVYHYMDDYLNGDEGEPINEMMDIDPTMIAGGAAALGSLYYMISSMKDAVEAGRKKEANEYMADIRRIMAKSGLKMPSTSPQGSDPKRAAAERELARMKAARGTSGGGAVSDIPLLADPVPATDVEASSGIKPEDLRRYINIVNTVRSNSGLNHASYQTAPRNVKRKIADNIKNIAASLIQKYGKENLDQAMNAAYEDPNSELVYEQ